MQREREREREREVAMVGKFDFFSREATASEFSGYPPFPATSLSLPGKGEREREREKSNKIERHGLPIHSQEVYRNG